MLSITASGSEAACVCCGGPIVLREADSEVCEGCTSGLVGSRILALLIDLAILIALSSLVKFAMAVSEAPNVVESLLGWILLFAFLMKDGISGHGPGKFVLGLQVIDATTGSPADYIDSARRNFPLLFLPFPFVWLIMLFQLRRGKRWGDGFANTRVVRANRSSQSSVRHSEPFSL